MFQVDPDNVLFATGRKKATGGTVDGIAGKPKKTGEEVEEAEEEDTAEVEADTAKLAAQAAEELSETEQVEREIESGAVVSTETLSPEKALERLKRLSKYAKELVESKKSDLKPKQKIKIRHFIASAKSSISRAGKEPTAEDVAGNRNLMDEITVLIDKLTIAKPEKPKELVTLEVEAGVDSKPAPEADETALITPKEPRSRADLSPQELEIFNNLLREEEENPTDPDKPYHTPWRPRRYMAPFAFIPRYLEVNQNVCSAVYLRHPVARLGLAEVPTPFPPGVMQLAFNWYLRRR